MKLLSEKKCIYLLLFDTLLSILVTIIVLLFAYPDNGDILQKNVFYQIVSFSITLFIYLNISKINSQLKIASFLIILKAFINIFIITILPMFTPIMIFNLSLSNVLEFITLSLSIPFSFFFYNGCAMLVSQKTKNMLLVNKWKELATLNILIAVVNLIFHIIQLYGDPKLAELPLALSFPLMAFTVYLEILRIIYLFKTAKELK